MVHCAWVQVGEAMVKDMLDEGVEGLREYGIGGVGAGMRSLQSVVVPG